jgi:hypothetical protein
MAWARALDERGESDKSRYVAQRLKEFRNEQADEFFAPCAAPGIAAAFPALAASAGGASAREPPFQCLAPARPLRFEDFR